MRTLLISMIVAACATGAARAEQAPAGAQSPEAMNKVYACAEIADAQQRLACFDAAVAGMKTAETRGDFAAVDANRVRQIQRESFGFMLPSLPRLGLPSARRTTDDAAEELPQSQAMTIARTSRFDGRNSFVMDNGQVWVLLDTQSNRFAREGAAVTVRKATLGSYLMSVEAGGPALRVRRAQ